METLSNNEIELAKQINVDPAIFSILKKYTESEIKQLTVLDSDFVHEIPFRGIYVNGSYEKLIVMYNRINESLIKKGYISFITISKIDNKDNLFDGTDMEAFIKNQIHRLAIIKTNDPYDILRIKKTDGMNYGISTDDIINTLKKWNREFTLEFTIISATETSFHLKLKTIPRNPDNFVDEALSFCPDLYEAQPFALRSKYDTETEQGYLILEKTGMIKMIELEKEIGFWWD